MLFTLVPFLSSHSFEAESPYNGRERSLHSSGDNGSHGDGLRDGLDDSEGQKGDEDQTNKDADEEVEPRNLEEDERSERPSRYERKDVREESSSAATTASSCPFSRAVQNASPRHCRHRHRPSCPYRRACLGRTSGKHQTTTTTKLRPDDVVSSFPPSSSAPPFSFPPETAAAHSVSASTASRLSVRPCPAAPLPRSLPPAGFLDGSSTACPLPPRARALLVEGATDRTETETVRARRRHCRRRRWKCPCARRRLVLLFPPCPRRRSRRRRRRTASADVGVETKTSGVFACGGEGRRRDLGRRRRLRRKQRRESRWRRRRLRGAGVLGGEAWRERELAAKQERGERERRSGERQVQGGEKREKRKRAEGGKREAERRDEKQQLVREATRELRTTGKVRM